MLRNMSDTSSVLTFAETLVELVDTDPPLINSDKNTLFCLFSAFYHITYINI